MDTKTSLIRVKFGEEQNIYIISKYKLFTTYKGESGNFMVEKFGRQHLFQLLGLHNKLSPNSPPLINHLLSSWILGFRNLDKVHQGWLVSVP